LPLRNPIDVGGIGEVFHENDKFITGQTRDRIGPACRVPEPVHDLA
jgi:hypothetical protein